MRKKDLINICYTCGEKISADKDICDYCINNVLKEGRIREDDK